MIKTTWWIEKLYGVVFGIYRVGQKTNHIVIACVKSAKLFFEILLVFTQYGNMEDVLHGWQTQGIRTEVAGN